MMIRRHRTGAAHPRDLIAAFLPMTLMTGWRAAGGVHRLMRLDYWGAA